MPLHDCETNIPSVLNVVSNINNGALTFKLCND